MPCVLVVAVQQLGSGLAGQEGGVEGSWTPGQCLSALGQPAADGSDSGVL